MRVFSSCQEKNANKISKGEKSMGTKEKINPKIKKYKIPKKALNNKLGLGPIWLDEVKFLNSKFGAPNNRLGTLVNRLELLNLMQR